ncbi:hypothetical protein PTTG_12007 [Puccinia triticina 1-1 BBBD Race 1]|uniref:Peptidase A2 domain-containing protein n=1 Tax=Puccinia triticina (isolate 1-1 / race 1 (BBBD)) TaxID=630390 RepID=A0A180G0X6_PUCT1|nr:hypothetical protein PTTG_12007 [Puccinia triticina 1-1 BBBD Race 1]
MDAAREDPPRARMVKIKPQDKALKFTGSDVEQFLDSYELAAELDGASDYDKARQIGSFVEPGETRTILATLDGYKPPEWSKLKASMLSYWVDVDKALFTERDITSLVDTWTKKGGVSSVSDYHSFRKAWDPIQAYLVSKGHVESAEELKKPFYQAFSEGFQSRIRDQLIKEDTLIVTSDNRARLPSFKIVRGAVDTVMKGQVSLTFEDTRTSAPVISPFQASNETMKKMGEDKRPKGSDGAPKPDPSVEELTRLFKAFEQYMKKEGGKGPNSTERPPLVCYYCHRENHGTSRCQELVKDKEAGLVEQRGTNFFLPNGALIPFDRTRPIRHVVASYQPSSSTAPPRTSTPTRKASNMVSADYKTSCGSLQPWYPPAVSSQSFAGAYEADPAGRKRHEEPRTHKAPLVPPSHPKRPIRKASGSPADSEKANVEDETELFDRIMNDPVPSNPSQGDAPARPATPPKAAAPPRVRFEREVSRDHPDAVEGVLRKISDLSVSMTVAEICSISPAVADGMKKWVARRRVEVGPEDLKVHSGTLAEGTEFAELTPDPNLYSCPLGYLACLVGAGEHPASPLVDSGSQLNIISDAMAKRFNLTPRVNFSSAVYGINNQACELIGVAEDVPIRVGKSIVGSCHFWITRQDSPFILGRPFLIDFEATLLFSPSGGERIILPDPEGRNIEFLLCPTEKGRWERDFPGHGKKAVLTHCGRIVEWPDKSSVPSFL